DGPFGPMMGVTGLPGDGGQALLERLRTRLGRIRTALRCGQVLLEPVEPGGELRALPRDLCVLLRDVAAQGRLALLPPRLPVMQRCVPLVGSQRVVAPRRSHGSRGLGLGDALLVPETSVFLVGVVDVPEAAVVDEVAEDPEALGVPAVELGEVRLLVELL